MAQSVKVLSAEVANRIAAGEIVERPASVVKELVENSVDAGAAVVRVRVEGAGKALVAVDDDGAGMSRDDAVLAMQRHATSKISAAEDLDLITTLGFRGEALPSIASVSRFRLLTRTADEHEGTRVLAEGGKVVSVETAGAARGTSVEVRDLFFNTPARLKFLKADATELRHIVDTVTFQALVHPGVGFELRNAGKLLLAVAPGLALEERAAELVGSQCPGGIHWYRGRCELGKLTLAYAAPHDSKGHRGGVQLFVNGRPVQDRVLFRAVMEGFRGVLEAGRFPVALLWLDLDPTGVDVNVHPAKREVRFRDEGRVFRWAAGSVADAVAWAPWLNAGLSPEAKPQAFAAVEGAMPEGSGSSAAGVAEALAGYASRLPSGGRDANPRWRGASSARLALGDSAKAAGSWPEPQARAEAWLRSPFGTLRWVGSFGAAYLLFEDLDARELVVFDQHAAHERILYEALLGAPAESPKPQPLLLPLIVECSASEMAAFDERRADVEALGFRAEPFGLRSLAVAEIPAGVERGTAEAVVRDLLGAEDLTQGDDRREKLAARAACAGAVKAGSALLPSEAETLVRRLSALRNPSHCPHGRPLVVRIGRAEIEKMFHRK